MKKLSILLLAVFYISLSNITAQEATTNETATPVESVEEVKKCAKTGEPCLKTCSKKKNGTCCQSKKANSSCNKSKKGSFNFNKSNNYAGKSSCSKSKAKKCCKKKSEDKAKSEEVKSEDKADEEKSDEE